MFLLFDVTAQLSDFSDRFLFCPLPQVLPLLFQDVESSFLVIPGILPHHEVISSLGFWGLLPICLCNGVRGVPSMAVCLKNGWVQPLPVFPSFLHFDRCAQALACFFLHHLFTFFTLFSHVSTFSPLTFAFRLLHAHHKILHSLHLHSIKAIRSACGDVSGWYPYDHVFCNVPLPLHKCVWRHVGITCHQQRGEACLSCAHNHCFQ